MDVWDLVEQTLDMHVLPLTMTFKCKRYLVGLPKKHKARLCVQGDQQIGSNSDKSEEFNWNQVELDNL